MIFIKSKNSDERQISVTCLINAVSNKWNLGQKHMYLQKCLSRGKSDSGPDERKKEPADSGESPANSALVSLAESRAWHKCEDGAGTHLVDRSYAGAV